MYAAIGLFAIAAVGGLVLALQRLRDKPLSMPLALIHGLVAAAALLILLFTVVGSTLPVAATVAVVGFVIAALGGFFLFSFHLRSQKLPIPVMAVHAVVAVGSFVTLLVAAFVA